MNKLGSAKAFSTNSRKILLMIVRNPGLNQQKDTFSAPRLIERSLLTLSGDRRIYKPSTVYRIAFLLFTYCRYRW